MRYTARNTMPAHRLDTATKFWRKVTPSDDGSCWIWQGKKNRYGYGRMTPGYRGTGEKGAHRVAYELLVGPIPEGLVLDHLCRVRDCVNPAHLEPTTIGENVMRGDTHGARNRAKTHCAQGHPFIADNIYASAGRARECRTCKLVAVRKYRATHAEGISIRRKARYAAQIRDSE